MPTVEGMRLKEPIKRQVDAHSRGRAPHQSAPRRQVDCFRLCRKPFQPFFNSNSQGFTMVGEVRFLGWRELSASQTVASGPVDRLKNVKIAVEEFSNSSSVNRLASKQTRTPCRYLWAAVLSVTAALTIAFMLRKCFHTLSHAVENKLSGSIPEGGESGRHLSESDAGQCQFRAANSEETPGHQFSPKDDGDEGDAVTPAEQSALLGAADEGSDDEAPPEHGSEGSGGPSSLRTSQSANSEALSFLSAVRWLCCCSFLCGLHLWGKKDSHNLAGSSSELVGFFRRRSSGDNKDAPLAGAAGEENIESFAASEEDQTDTEGGSETGGGPSTEVSGTGAEEGLETEGGFAEGDDETHSEGGPELLVDVAEKAMGINSETKNCGDETGAVACSSWVAIDADDAVETEGGDEDGENKTESVASSGLGVEGAAEKTGKSKPSSRNPRDRAPPHLRRRGKHAAARRARWRLLSQTISGSTSSGSPESAQLDDTPGRDGDSLRCHRLLHKIFATWVAIDADNAVETEGGDEDGENKTESVASSGFGVEGAAEKTGKSKPASRNPRARAPPHLRRRGKHAAARRARLRLLSQTISGSTSSGSPESAQLDDTPGRDDSLRYHRLLHKIFATTTSPRTNDTTTKDLPTSQSANSNTDGSRLLQEARKTNPRQAESAGSPLSRAGNLADNAERKGGMATQNSAYRHCPESFAERTGVKMKLVIPRRGPPREDEPLSSMVARGVPWVLIEEEKARRRRHIRDAVRAEAERLSSEFTRAWLRGLPYLALWMVSSDDDVFDD